MEIDKWYIFGKLLVRAFDFDSKCENLLTSARFIAKELYKEYDDIVTSHEFVRIQIYHYMCIISPTPYLPNFSSKCGKYWEISKIL